MATLKLWAPGRRPAGPEVGFEEIAIDLLQARFWRASVCRQHPRYLRLSVLHAAQAIIARTLWLLLQAPSLARMKSCRRWAPAAWVRCIAHAIPGSSATSPSRCFLRT